MSWLVTAMPEVFVWKRMIAEGRTAALTWTTEVAVPAGAAAGNASASAAAMAPARFASRVCFIPRSVQETREGSPAVFG
jgi:threonine synthase